MKSILLHIDGDAEPAGGVAVARDLARQFAAHVACVEILAGDAIIDDDRVCRRRAAVAAGFRREGIGFAWRSFESDTTGMLIAEARLADIVVVARATFAGGDDDPSLALVADLLLHLHAPLLLAPPHVEGLALVGDVMLAWNGSAAAAQAMRAALPLLRRAARVHVVEVAEAPAPVATIPMGDAVAYLARAGVAADSHDWPGKGRGTAAALQAAARELSVGYLVMGGRVHGRSPRATLGSVVAAMVGSSATPLLLAN